MSASNMEEMLARAERANRATNTVDDNMKAYSQWAPTYDTDHGHFPSKGPGVVARTVGLLFGGNKDALILDAGAGTGVGGKELQNIGFTNLEALDGCQAMLDIANQKGVYKRTICDLLGPNRLDVDSDYYDCVVCVGAMAANNANAGCLPELIRITKSGGYVVIATREIHIPDCGYDGTSWNDWLKIHEDNGLWKKVEIKKVEDYFCDHMGLIFIYHIM